VSGAIFRQARNKGHGVLSAAKHLQYVLENTKMQMLCFAHDDSPTGLFPAACSF
jgi:hypothetical protein